MITEIKLKYYNSDLKIGFNSPREGAYDVNTGQWLPVRVHAGRLVYGEKRIPYKRIVSNITHCNFIAQNYYPW